MTDERNYYKEALEKSRILGCQWTKRHVHNTFRDEHCAACKDRFACFLMVAKRFRLGACESIYNVFHTFAEGEDQARSNFYFGDDEKLAPKDPMEGGDGDIELMDINEVDAAGFVLDEGEELPDIEVTEDDSL